MHRFARGVAFGVVTLTLIASTLTAFATSNAAAQSGQTIADIAVDTADLSTLVTALSAAADGGGTDFLTPASDPGASLTVFAPTNAAFAALGDTLDAALADPAGLLSTVLANHVVTSEKSAAALIAQRSVTAINGEQLQITNRDGVYYIGDAKLVLTDIQASNGVVHVIDAVLVPALPGETPVQNGTFDTPSVEAPAAAAEAAPAAAGADSTATESMALANTGSESVPLFVAAALLMMLGAVVLLGRDRRELAVVNARINKPTQLSNFSWPEAPSMPEHSAFSDELERTRKNS